MRGKWSEVPDDIKNTFERLGIPQAERSSLAGVGAPVSYTHLDVYKRQPLWEFRWLGCRER